MRAACAASPSRAEADAALHEVDRLSAIVEELLVLSRAGEHELPAERIDLGEAARRAAERWQRAGADRASIATCVRLRDRGGEGHGAWCARPDLDRALDALVENAILYSPPARR